MPFGVSNIYIMYTGILCFPFILSQMFNAEYVEFIFYKTFTIKICIRVWKIIIVVSVLFSEVVLC